FILSRPGRGTSPHRQQLLPIGRKRQARFRSDHAKRMQIELKDRLLLLTLCLVLLAQTDHLTQRLRIETIAFGFGIDFLDVVGDGRLFFLEPLDTLDDGPQLVLRDAARSRRRITVRHDGLSTYTNDCERRDDREPGADREYGYRRKLWIEVSMKTGWWPYPWPFRRAASKAATCSGVASGWCLRFHSEKGSP